MRGPIKAPSSPTSSGLAGHGRQQCAGLGQHRTQLVTVQHLSAAWPIGGWCRTGVYGAGVIDSGGREWFNGRSPFANLIGGSGFGAVTACW
jgi:hypothetical protein